MKYRPRLHLIAVSTPLVTGLAVALLLWQPWAKEGNTVSNISENESVGVLSPIPSATALTGILATTDLSVGSNRVSFLLVSPDTLITIPEASVTSLYVTAEGPSSIIKEKTTSSFYLWPYGTRGNHTTQLTFDKPGTWELDVRVEDGEEFLGNARIPLNVEASSITPTIGSPAPIALNKTSADVTSLDELTSWSSPDPELYDKTIAEAIAGDKPSVVVFASPAFCTSPTCGPQVETVQELKESYKDQANFIHVEVYDNPDEIQGNIDRALYSPVVEAWKLNHLEGYLNESWVFILDTDGQISAKYEGFASTQELEAGLLQVLESRSS